MFIFCVIKWINYKNKIIRYIFFFLIINVNVEVLIGNNVDYKFFYVYLILYNVSSLIL